MFTRLYGFETVTIRYFNVFGPRQDPGSPYSGVISLFATALLEGRQPIIYGDGEQTRDFTYVANVVDGVLRACEAPGAAGEVINVATGGRISLNELLRTMNRIVGTTVEPIYKEARAGDVRDSQADITKAPRSARLRADRGARRGSDAHAGLGADGPPLARVTHGDARAIDPRPEMIGGRNRHATHETTAGDGAGPECRAGRVRRPNERRQHRHSRTPTSNDAARRDDGRRAVLVCHQRARRHGDHHRHGHAGRRLRRCRLANVRAASPSAPIARGVRRAERITHRRAWRRREDAATSRQGRRRHRRGRYEVRRRCCGCCGRVRIPRPSRSALTVRTRSSPTKTPPRQASCRLADGAISETFKVGAEPEGIARHA